MSLACRHRGQTLLELIAATAILAGTLVPALRIMRDALEQDRRIETLELLATLCADKLEEHMCKTPATWSIATVTGDFAADGYVSLRYSVTSTDDPASGGIVGRLMALTATVWEDANGNTALDPGELSATFRSKVASMGGYPL